MQQGGLQAQTEKRITELKKLTHELEIHGCGQENAIYDLAAEMADVEGSIQKELDHFRHMFDEARHRTVENNKRVSIRLECSTECSTLCGTYFNQVIFSVKRLWKIQKMSSFDLNRKKNV